MPLCIRRCSKLQWVKVLEDTNRFLTKEGQVLVDGGDYWTLDERFYELPIPVEVRRT